MKQWHQIQQIPGVKVAAPIAMVGYAQFDASAYVPVPAAALAGSGRQLYRISTTYINDNGASRVTQPPGYLYVTPLRLRGGDGIGPATDGTGPGCELGNGASVVSPAMNPFGTAVQSYPSCWTRLNQYNAPKGAGAVDTEAGYWVEWSIPVLVAGNRPGRRGGTGRAEQGGCLRQLPEGERG
jgi:hypothetical protein